jgi:hypothetical protein
MSNEIFSRSKSRRDLSIPNQSIKDGVTSPDTGVLSSRDETLVVDFELDKIMSAFHFMIDMSGITYPDLSCTVKVVASRAWASSHIDHDSSRSMSPLCPCSFESASGGDAGSGTGSESPSIVAADIYGLLLLSK